MVFLCLFKGFDFKVSNCISYTCFRYLVPIFSKALNLVKLIRVELVLGARLSFWLFISLYSPSTSVI